MNAPARRAFHVGIREARRRQHDFVGTEHLLFGLLADGSAPAVALLHSLSVPVDDVVHELEEGFRKAETDATLDRLPVSPALKRVIAAAEREVQAGGQTLASPGDLLLALLGETDCQASVILRSRSVVPGSVREAMHRLSPAENEDFLLHPKGKASGLAAPSAEDLLASLAPLNEPQSPVRIGETPLTVAPSSAEGVGAMLETSSSAESMAILSQLRKTQLVMGALLGFVLGTATISWPAGVLFGIAGMTVAMMRNSYVSSLTGAMCGFCLPENAQGMFDLDLGGSRILFALLGAFLGSFLGDFWRRPPTWLQPRRMHLE